MRRVVSLLGLMRGVPVALAAACVADVPAPPESAVVQLSASDFRDVPQAAESLPRRPRLTLRHPAGFSAGDQAFALFAGRATPDWIEDLQRAPLRSEHSAALIELELERGPAEEALQLIPSVPLEADADYVMAVAGWAKSRRGSPLNGDGEPQLFALHTAAGEQAGARVVSSWPADGSSAVAAQLARAVLAFDGIVDGAETGIWLEDASGLAVPATVDGGPCQELAPEHDASHCVELRPRAALARDTAHRLVIGSGALDAHGAPVGPFAAEFRTAAHDDTSAPALRIPNCAVDEQRSDLGCALILDESIELRALSDEPALASLHFGSTTLGAISAGGEFRLRAAPLRPDRDIAFELILRDSAGNAARHVGTLRTARPLPTLQISELLADPLGPEPRQEWVELLNFGGQPVELRGIALGDRVDALGTAIQDSHMLAPQTRVLLVADDFDPVEGSDAAPPAGAALLRMGRALTGSGLNNAGEALYLRDAQAHRVSTSPAAPKPRPGVCSVRVDAGAPRSPDPPFVQAQACSPGR